MQQKYFNAQIVKREDVASDLFKLWLTLEDVEQFTFNPGQYCTIGLPAEDGSGVIWRPYSIVSAPHENSIEIFIELVPPPEGNLTPLLYDLKVGDQVYLLPKAKGIFLFEPKYRNQIMVATVTGIAPFMSMLRNYEHEGNSGHSFYVLQGASYMDEFGYDKELELLKLRGMDLKYQPTVSRPEEDRNNLWGRQTGRVNNILEEYLTRWGISEYNTIVYACGHPEMIRDVKARLAPKIWKVKEERYWK